jgi:tetratricopeptide (TPR) repeat protein
MKNNLRLFLFASLFWPQMNCFGQLSSFGKNQNTDSLKLLLQKDAEDSNKVIHLCAMAREISRHNIDSAEDLSKKAMLISQHLNYSEGLALANIHLGWCDIVKGNYLDALKKLSSAHTLAAKINNQRLVSIALTNMGTIYHNELEFDKALQYFFQSLAIDQKINNEWGIARNWGVIGLSYFKMNNDSSALNYYRMALQLTNKLGNYNGSAVWTGNMGDIYFRQKKYQQALNYYQKALSIFSEIKNSWVMAEMKIKIAKIYELEKNFPEANQLLNEALVLSKSIGALDRQKDVYLALSDLYASSNVLLMDNSGKTMLNFEQQKLHALNHFKNAKEIQDSLFSREKQKDLAKFEQAKIDAIKEAELNNEKKMSFYYIISSITFFIGLMVAIGLTIFARKKLNENKIISRELVLKNLIIENKQKEITDSIEYAQRIQFAILPSLEDIKSYFPKSFVLFMPKDIV